MDKRLHRWKWRLPVLFISVLLLSMAAYGVFDTAVTDPRGGLVGRYVVTALMPLLADLNLPDSLSVRQFIGASQRLWGRLHFSGLLRYQNGSGQELVLCRTF